MYVLNGSFHSNLPFSFEEKYHIKSKRFQSTPSQGVYDELISSLTAEQHQLAECSSVVFEERFQQHFSKELTMFYSLACMPSKQKPQEVNLSVLTGV